MTGVKCDCFIAYLKPSVCKEMSSGSFKYVNNKMYLQILYLLNRIWH